MKARLLVAIGVVALAIASAWWFVRNFEPVAERVWVGFHGEAARDRFLAAELFLARMGVEVSLGRSVTRLGDLDRTRVAIVPARRQSLAPGEIALLVRWVEAGGHLIVQAERANVEDPLLAELGIPPETKSRAPRRGKAEADTAADRPPDGDDAEEASAQGDARAPFRLERLADVMLPNASEPVIVRVRQGIELAANASVPDFQWRDAQGRLHVASFAMERGRVTVLSTLPFTNALIDAHDHAGFLYHLVH